jgi:hypothetical protein
VLKSLRSTNNAEGLRMNLSGRAMLATQGPGFKCQQYRKKKKKIYIYIYIYIKEEEEEKVEEEEKYI